MDVEKLKQKILDLAIRGKLVPQDPNDEPASVLIEKIKAEKAKLVKEGKIKASRDDSYIFKGSDNSYYENMPKSWVYSRLDYVSYITMGQSPNGANVFNVEKEDSIEFHQGKIAFSDWLILNSGKYCVKYNKIAQPGSLLFCVRAPVGEINYTNRKIAIGRGLCAIKPAISFIDTKFLYYCLLFLKKFFLSKGSGSTFDAITIDVLKKCIIPIPPLNEQNRIVSILDKTFLVTKSIRDNYNKISNFSEYAKQKILESIFGDNSSYKSYYKKTIKLGSEINTISTRNKEIKSRDVKPNGKYKVVSQSKNNYDGFSDDESLLINNIPVVIFGDHTRVVKKVDYSFIPGADGTKIIKPKSIDFDYFYYCVLYASLKIDDKGYGRHFSLLKEVEVPIYSLKKQKEISSDITSFFKILDAVIC